MGFSGCWIRTISGQVGEDHLSQLHVQIIGLLEKFWGWNEILAAKPELSGVIERLVGQISTDNMQELNFLADNNLMEPSVVAENFLIEHNYFSDEEADQ